ncbi:MAG: hypothetical protein AAGB26_17785 [Planctomycetota bacterium]
MIEGRLNVGDQILATDPETILPGRIILAVETGARVKGGRFVGLCIAEDTDPDIEQLQSIQISGIKIMVADQG